MRFLPRINKQDIARLVLSLALIGQFSPFIELAGQLAHQRVINSSFVLKRTYVSQIKADFHTTNKVKKSLDYFNSLGDNKIVQYEKPNTKYTRDIVIVIREFTAIETFMDWAGVAYPGLDECQIHMEPHTDEVMFEQVLIHEYLHCMGYDHLKHRADVMYPSYRPVTEANLRKYASKLLEKMK